MMRRVPPLRSSLPPCAVVVVRVERANRHRMAEAFARRRGDGPNRARVTSPAASEPLT